MKKLNAPTLYSTLFCLICLGLTACKKDVQSNKNSISSVSSDNARAVVLNLNEKIPTDLAVNVPCANGGAGEDIMLSGPLHATEHLTINDNNFILKYHFQPQDIKGVGVTTGLKYKATGETQEVTKGSFVNGQFTDTYTNNFRIIGQGPGNNYIVHENIHITVNANGTVTSTVDNFITDCK